MKQKKVNKFSHPTDTLTNTSKPAGAYLYFRHRLKVFLLLLVVVFSAVILPFSTSTNVSAATDPEAAQRFNDGITNLLYKNALATCFTYSPLRDGSFALLHDNISESNAANYLWFSDVFTPGTQPLDVFAGRWLYDAGAPGVDEYGKVSCSNAAFVQAALSALGYSAAAGDTDAVFYVMCDIGFRRAGTAASDSTSDCLKNGTGSWYRPSKSSTGTNAERDTFLNSPRAATINGLSNAQAYLLLYNTFLSTCDITVSDKGAANISQGVTDIKVYEEGQKEPVIKNATWGNDKRSFSISGNPSDMYTPGILSKDTTNLPAGTVSAGSVISGSVRIGASYNGCVEFANKINELAEDYINWVLTNGIDPSEETPDINKCRNDPEAEGCETELTTSCNIPDIGWLLCPVLRTGANLADSAYGYLSENFLEVDSGLFTSDQTAAAWGVIRNIANVAFVIVFLIVIFSQLTGVGVSNYGVKKLLPRLIIGAILVNTSFFICQLAVDLSNIAGYGLKNMFTGISGEVLSTDTSQIADQSGHLGGILSLVIAGAAGVALIWINLGAVILAIVAGLITLLTVFVLLIARQTFIVLLVVISPLAFIAYLLPNTEKYFQQWRKIFTGLLLLFPIIGLLYGAAQLASSILLAAAGDDVILQVAAYLALVIPLFAIWPLLKGSMNAIPAIGNAIQNMGKKTSGVAQKGTKSAYDNSRLGQRMEYNKGMRAKKRSQIYSGTYSGNNPISRLRSAKNRLQNSMSGDFGKRLSDRGIALENKEEAEAITNAEQSLRRASTTNPAAAEEALKAALKSGDKVQAKAAQNLLFAQGSSGMRKFHSAVTEAQTNGSAHSSAVNALRENINANHGQMVKTKAMDVSKWASLGGDLAAHTSGGPNGDTWSGMSQADMAGQTGDSLQRAANAGKLDPVTASALLSNGQLNGNLDAKQKAALHQAAGTTVATQQASTTPQPTTVESVQTAAGGDAYDRRNAQRQEELSTQSAAGEIPDMPEEFRVWHEEQARRANPSAADRGSSTDEHGTQTPDLAAEDYHERMRGGGG